MQSITRNITPLKTCLTGLPAMLMASALTYAQPNIILLMGDDHGWDEVGYNGHPFVKTPTLDEMAEQGLRFDRFYAAHPTSSPTRASVLTGRHPNRYGTFNAGWSTRPEEITLAHVAKNAGYATAHFGKWHVGPVKKESPTNPGAMGFDQWLSHDNFFEMNPVLSRNGSPPEKVVGEGSEIIVNEAMAFIREAMSQDTPFLAVVWFGSPHEPYSGLPKDLALYDNLPDSLQNREVLLTSNETGEQVYRPLREVLQERYAEITAMDRAIGNLREFLQEEGLSENTLLMYVSDNGTCPSAGRTGMTLRAQKSTLYEGGIRVPAIIEWPAVITKPSNTSMVAVTTDILPTLAEITQQPLPNRPIDGMSLVPLFRNSDELHDVVRESPVFFWQFAPGNVFSDDAEPYIPPELQEGTTPMVKALDGKFTRDFQNFTYHEVSDSHFSGTRAIISGHYKLILEGHTPNKQGMELYNIEADPAETTNLADRHPEKAEEMKLHLRQWQASVLNSLTGADY